MPKTTYLIALLLCILSPAIGSSADDPEAIAARMAGNRETIRKAAARIDQIIQEDWELHDVKPSLPASDQIFMRRVYLEITGTIPTGVDALGFLDEKKMSNKREVLIDYLLQTDGYTSHFYNYWADVLRIKSNVNAIELHGYVKWIKDSLRKNKPYDRFVYELVSAEGRPYENGAVGYYLRDQGMPLDNLGNTVAIFLGTQIGCAQCHDHPFEQWTQRDFYQMAAFTWGVNTRATSKQFQQARNAVNAEVKKRGLSSQQRQVVNQLVRYNQWELSDAPNKTLKFPADYDYDDVKPNSLVTPRTIFGDNPSLKEGESRREAFARWMTSKENPLFARVIANRLWKKVMGVGLIEPPDDIEGAKATNAKLLDFLTYAMVRLNFDMKQYIRMIMYTDVYQRRAVFKDIDEEVYHYPGPVLRRMTAEQIWDSLVTLSMDDPMTNTYEHNAPYRFPFFNVAATPASRIVDQGVELHRERENRRKGGGRRMSMNMPGGKKKPTGPNLSRASEMRQPVASGHFLRDFGASDRELIEGGNTDPTVSQILTLINGSHHYQIVREGSQLMALLKKADKNDKLRMRIIYLSILGREPYASERPLAMGVFKQEKSANRGNRELIWILLNTPEFMFIQ